MMAYAFHIGIVLMVYIILVVSSHLLINVSRLISLGQAAFFGIGAYITALVAMGLGLSLIPALLAVMLVNASVAAMLAWPVMKLKGDYFILATLAFQFIVFSILYNWTAVTGGSLGVSGIPAPEILPGVVVSGLPAFFAMTLIITVIVAFLFYKLQYSYFGLLVKAQRDSEPAMKAAGRDTQSTRVYIFVISGAFIGVASYLYATYMSYIHPAGFNLEASIFILLAVFVGGTEKLRGAVMGAALIVLLPEFLRFARIPEHMAGHVNQIIFGLALIVLVIFKSKSLKPK
ncbi:MAG: branched-chain amino acid ABC transporter permease [Bacteroidetes bacterium]|nr:branched-chain amino acid ABC transporter permease [Bacteroidota bacterium]